MNEKEGMIAWTWDKEKSWVPDRMWNYDPSIIGLFGERSDDRKYVFVRKLPPEDDCFTRWAAERLMESTPIYKINGSGVRYPQSTPSPYSNKEWKRGSFWSSCDFILDFCGEGVGGKGCFIILYPVHGCTRDFMWEECFACLRTNTSLIAIST